MAQSKSLKYCSIFRGDIFIVFWFLSALTFYPSSSGELSSSRGSNSKIQPHATWYRSQLHEVPGICLRQPRGRRVVIWFLSALLCMVAFSASANPWLPEKGGWKYNIQYSKYTTPKSIKFYERDIYFALEKEKSFIRKEFYDFAMSQNKQIDIKKEGMVAYEKGLPDANPIEKQRLREAIYNRNKDIAILMERLGNAREYTMSSIKKIENLQKYLITSYHNWHATNDIEYGINRNMSYGINFSYLNSQDKYKAKREIDKFAIFFKNKIYENKGYIITLQPKLLSIGRLQAIDFTCMVGKSYVARKKFLGKKVEFFGYGSYGGARFLSNEFIKGQLHASIVSGIKWNYGTMFINEESEELNFSLGPNYKRVLRSQFTVAQNLNFANMDSRNKLYLALSYFTIDSLKAKRRLSAGYSVGLWLEF